ncbi:MAG TPA: hypothetical protein VFO69_12140 [Allosphingosinicella sp.]|nr:hypothetical protein [Allosphingosinicella sp.]
MKSWPSKLLLLAGVATLAVAIPAASQDRDSPESLLPPGFGDPGSSPPPPPPPDNVPGQATPPGFGSEQPTSPSPASPPRSSLPIDGLAEVDEADVEGLEGGRPLNYFTIPDGAERPVDMVGVLDPGNFGLGPAAFGNAGGAYLATLMRQLDAPLPSRWTTILLRRALLSRVTAPARIHPVDWVAARAGLLLQMGDADAARLLVQSVDRELYTPLMVQTAAQAALATADPASLCPIVEPARGLSDDDAVWTLAEAMCAALEGEPARADALVDQARRQGGGGIDLRLAEKIVGAGAQTRRSVTIDWEGVDEITPWRFGLASATGVEIPGILLRDADPRINAWLARAPMVPLEQRVEAAWTAASLGIFSSRSLVDIHSLLFDATDPAEVAGTVGARLRTAWTHRQPAERVEAMRGLWGDGSPQHRYAHLILTAGAAARIQPSPDFAGQSFDLIASMLSAGMDREAARWAGVVEEEGGDRGWALIALGSAQPGADVSANRVEAFIDADDSEDKRRSRALVAALAGLGRLSGEDAAALASASGFRLSRDSRWARAIDQAARLRQPATVALLAAVGMQTDEWSGVPPSSLFRLVRALRIAGLEYEARMIAAEALTRL